jgi:hypothetical protein
MALNTTFTSGQILTAAQMNNLPWGIAGSSILLNDNSYTTLEDSGLTVTWDAVSSRQYKLSFYGVIEQSVSALVQYFITNSANAVLTETTQISTGTSNIFTLSSFGLVTGLSGSVTYKVRMETNAGTGILFGGNTRAGLAARLLVEDIGPA